MNLLYSCCLAYASTRSSTDLSVMGPIEPAPGLAFDPRVVTDEMRSWARKIPVRGVDDDSKMLALVAALRKAHPWEFTQSYTGTAVEVFEEGRFNCLGLAHLVVALGREMGVETRYVLVEDRRSFHEQDDLVLSSTHVTAAWGPAYAPRLIELDEPDAAAARASLAIDDRRALALHFANRGAELLLIGQPELARDWLEQGIAIDPDVPQLWTNLGVARRYLHDDMGAERAWLESIALEPDNLSAYRDLASLYLRRHDPDEARRLLSIAERPGNDDPFTWLALGDLHVGVDPRGADRFFRRALRFAPRDPQILAARAELALTVGDVARASRLADRALARDPNEPRALATRDRLAPVDQPEDAP